MKRRLAGLMMAVVCGAALSAQQPTFTIDDYTAGTDGLYSLPRSQDEIAEWQRASREIAEHHFGSAVARLDGLLRHASYGVVPLPQGIDRWIGLRLAVIETLRDMPAEGQTAYEKLCRRETGSLYSANPLALSAEQLLHLAERFPTAEPGRRARIRLGDLAMERGDGIRAAQHYLAATDASPKGSSEREQLGGRRTAARLLQRRFADAEPPTRNDPELAESIADSLPLADLPGWPAFGGGLDGSRTMDAPVGARAEPFRRPLRADGFELNPYAMHATGDITGVIVNDGHSLWCLDPIRSRLSWAAPGPMVGHPALTETREAINTDIILSCGLAPDIVVASLQVPDDVIGAARAEHFRSSISIIEKIPSRRLFAFDRSTGKRLWAHWDLKGGPVSERFRGHDACGPPLVHGDTVYCATHDQTGAIAYYLCAYDLHSGEPKWRRLICTSQQEVNMFGNARQEFAAGPIAISGGMILGTTNLGVCYAVDAADGRIRWVTGYPTIPLPQTQLRDQEPRAVFFANNPIVVADGVMATTPLDSDEVIAIDVDSGALEWRQPYLVSGLHRFSFSLQWLLGAVGSRFVLAGPGLVAIDARGNDGRPRLEVIAGPSELDEDPYRGALVPRGAIADDKIYYLGSSGSMRVLDLERRDDQRPVEVRTSGQGNLLLVGGVSVFARTDLVEIRCDLPALLADARRRLEERPDDPLELLHVATIEAAILDPSSSDAATSRVEALYERGLTAARALGLGGDTRLASRLARGLFQVSLDRALRYASDAPERATALLVRARDRALEPSQWLRAQQEIIALSAGHPQRMLAELELMAREHGREFFTFRDVGRLPVAVFALVESLPYLRPPQQAAVRAQLLLERYADIRYGSRSVGEIASAELNSLIEQHGREVYAAIEERAADALSGASGDSPRLRRVIADFPHSLAAAQATRLLLDAAVEAADLGVAIEAYRNAAQDGSPEPWLLRRLMLCAERAGNPGLARSLGERLALEHGGERSDLSVDDGRRFDQLELPDAAARAPDALPIELPIEELGAIHAESARSMLSYMPVQLAPGFARPARRPLVLMRDSSELLVFDIDADDPRSTDDARFVVTLDTQNESPLWLCGDCLVVIERRRVRGFDLPSGEMLWSAIPEGERQLVPLGAQGGVLHLQSHQIRDRSQPIRLLGVEPLSGSVLFDTPLPSWPEGGFPTATNGGLWKIVSGDERQPPRLLEIDPVSGTPRAATPLLPALIDYLQLEGRLQSIDLQNGFRVAGDMVLVQAAVRKPQAQPRLIAIDRRDGHPLWRWSGANSTATLRLGYRDGIVAIFERGPAGARLSVLDAATGEVLQEHRFGARANPMNWGYSRRDELMPRTLVISDKTDSLGLSLITPTGAGPNFRHPLPNADHISPSPLLGEDFLLLALRRKARGQPLIQALDLATRRGALPDGVSDLRLDLSRPLRLYEHDGLTIVETLDGVRWLGTPR